MYSIGKTPVIPVKVRELWKHVDAPPPSLVIALRPPFGKPGASTNYLEIGLTLEACPSCAILPKPRKVSPGGQQRAGSSTWTHSHRYN